MYMSETDFKWYFNSRATLALVILVSLEKIVKLISMNVEATLVSMEDFVKIKKIPTNAVALVRPCFN